MIRVSAINENKTEYNQWWRNFVDYYRCQKFDMSNEDDITKALMEWRATNVEESIFVDFENEQDLTMFMLRWA
jgi:hypothetical protein